MTAGRSLTDITLQGGALLAELEDYIRLRNPHSRTFG
jgi:hypothetical protein